MILNCSTPKQTLQCSVYPTRTAAYTLMCSVFESTWYTIPDQTELNAVTNASSCSMFVRSVTSAFVDNSAIPMLTRGRILLRSLVVGRLRNVITKLSCRKHKWLMTLTCGRILLRPLAAFTPPVCDYETLVLKTYRKLFPIKSSVPIIVMLTYHN